MKILIADDTPRALAKLGEMLEGLGCDVTRAENGQRAVDAFRQQPDSFDLAILDYAMPELDGFAAYQQMTEIGPTIPVAFVAGVSKAAVDPLAAQFNAVKVLQKPHKLNSIKKLLLKVQPDFAVSDVVMESAEIVPALPGDASSVTLQKFQTELSGDSSGGGSSVFSQSWDLSKPLDDSSDGWESFDVPQFLEHTQLRFGEFLHRRGKVTDEQLLNARREQIKKQVPLGAMGIERGWLNRRQVQSILEAQKKHGGRFGDVAVKLGMLTEEQRGKLISRQEQVSRRLGEVLVEQGAIATAELEEALTEFTQILDEPAAAALPSK